MLPLFPVYKIDNNSLSTCDVKSVCYYLASPNASIEIHDNATGCNSEAEILAACENNCLPEGITFTTQTQIDSFQITHPGCTEIEGNIVIHGSNIKNLDGLKVITSIRGSIEIGTECWGHWDYFLCGNDSLIDLTGLSNRLK